MLNLLKINSIMIQKLLQILHQLNDLNPSISRENEIRVHNLLTKPR